MALPSVFISYAHEDRSLAEVIAAGLSHRGCKVWIDEGELRAGDSIIDRIAEGVDQTDFLVGLVSGTSVDSDWCRRELSLALTGELAGDRIPKVIPLRVGQVNMPATLRDKLHLRLDPDRPEDVVQRLYQDLMSHHRDRAALSGTDAADIESQLDEAIPRNLPPAPPSPVSSPSAIAAGGTGAALRLRAQLVDVLRADDMIGAQELLRQERRSFEQAAHEAISDTETAHSGPQISIERFKELDAELAHILERRLGTLLPVVQYGSADLLRAELVFLAEQAMQDWGLGGGSYTAWRQSPRWLTMVCTYAAGAVACAVGRPEIVRHLYETPDPGDTGSSLATMRLLGAAEFANALELARFGRRLALNGFWHTAALLASSPLCAEHYPEVAPVLERALRQLSNFGWLVSALAGRDGQAMIHWWPGVGHYAGDAGRSDVLGRLRADPQFAASLARDVFGTDHIDVDEVEGWAFNAPGPRPA